MSQCSPLHPWGTPSHPVNSPTPSPNATTPPPPNTTNPPVHKTETCYYWHCNCRYTAIANNVASATAGAVDSDVDSAIDIAVTSNIVNSVDTYIATAIAIAVDIAVATAVVTATATAVGIVGENVVNIVDVAIVEPRVRFPAGAPSVCVRSGTVSLAPSFVHLFIYRLSRPLPGHILLQFYPQHWNLTSPPYLIMCMVIHHPQPLSWSCSSSHRETYQVMPQHPRLHSGVTLAFHQLANPITNQYSPPTLQTHPCTKWLP